MRSYRCRVCDHPLYFGNSSCLSCRTEQAYARRERLIVPLDAEGRYVDPDGATWYRCPNLDLSGCTWLTTSAEVDCDCCAMTRTRPHDLDGEGRERLRIAEDAKRHVLAELDSLGFTIVGKDAARGGDPDRGLAFDLLSSAVADGDGAAGIESDDEARVEPGFDKDSDDPGRAGETTVVIGHQDGVITLDLAESDDAHREQVRASLAEPYRTMLGHVRHEIGHYVQWQSVVGEELIGRCRELFGDETADYQAALDRHYADGPPPDWSERYLSTYATMHPFEDFAETWAHYLHICDTVETAGEYGLTSVAGVEAFSRFRDLVTGVWIPLATALNMVNRSMGSADLYPFVIAEPVLDKLDFVASLRPGAD